MEDFTWSRISLMFPEFMQNLSKELPLEKYLDKPTFEEKSIKFLLRDSYGIQIHLNQEIPEWISNEKSLDIDKIKIHYANLASKVYQNVKEEFNNSFDILESWRPYLRKYQKNSWEGHLQNHLDFLKANDGVSLFDYYVFHPQHSINKDTPTDLYLELKGIYRAHIIDKLEKHHGISQNVIQKGHREAANSITGKTICESLQNADKIYKIANDLGSLMFLHPKLYQQI